MAGYKASTKDAPFKDDGLIELTIPEAVLMSVKMDVAALGANTSLLRGQVLGKVTATGKYALYDSTAADGTEVIANTVVLMQDAEIVGADDQVTIIYEATSLKWGLLEFQTGADRTAWEAAAPDRLRSVTAELATV